MTRHGSTVLLEDHGLPLIAIGGVMTTLDEAWSQADAACKRRGVILEEVTRFNDKGDWWAAAWERKGDIPHTTATGPTPTAALQALTTRLLENPGDTE
jgi:hypothetical protein